MATDRYLALMESLPLIQRRMDLDSRKAISSGDRVLKAEDIIACLEFAAAQNDHLLLKVS